MPSTPVVFNQINDVAVQASTLTVLPNAPDTVVDLFEHFDDPFTTGLVATFNLSDPTLGGQVTATESTQIVLYDQDGEGAPVSVANFLNYVNDGDYVNTIIHRSISNFVIQGGGFTVDGLADTLANPANAVSRVPTDDPIQNEFSANRSNTRGTVAFAKLGSDPNSATSQWFFNLNDNSANLDNQNGGFTVFGEVLSEADLVPIDAIADLPASNETLLFSEGAFENLPRINSPIDDDDDLVRYQSITVEQRAELTFRIIGNTNPDVLDVSIVNNELVFDYLQAGTTDLTIQATNLQGVVVEDTFSVTVEAPEAALSQNDAATTRQNQAVEIGVLSNDLAPAGETLSVTSVSQPANGTVSTNADGTLTYTPSADFLGTDTFTYVVRDTSGNTSSANVNVTVTESILTATDDDAITPEGIAVVINVLNNDDRPAGVVLTVTAVTEPSSGTVINNDDGTVTYTPNAGFSGTDTFTYTIENPDGETQTATVTVTVTEPLDLNRDGQLDSEQAHVVSTAALASGDSGATDPAPLLTLSTAAGLTINNFTARANPAPATPDNPEEAAGVVFPVGFLDYQVTGLTESNVVVRLQLPETTADQAYNTFWNFGPTPDNPNDHWYEFLYDGTTGAEFIDTNNDGRADEVLLHFVDGQRGDVDRTVNGIIEDPGAPGVSQTGATLVNDGNVFAIEGEGAAHLNFTLQANNSLFVNQIGVVRVDAQNRVEGLAPGEAGFTEAALRNGQLLFNAPRHFTGDTFLPGMDLTRGLQFSAGDRLLTYLVANGTTEQVLQGGNANVFFGIANANGDGLEHVQVTEAADELTIAFEDAFGGGDQDFDDVILTLDLGAVATPNQLIAARQGGPVGELLDFTSPVFAGQQVQVDLTATREAGDSSTFGFYRVDDAEGTVTDPVTGERFRPGSLGYSQAAQRLSLETGSGLRLTQATETTAVFDGGGLYAPFLIMNQTLETGITNQLVYFAFAGASFDGFDHVQLLGDNTFGFEDRLFGGDQDFNDFVVQVDVAIL